MSKLNLYFLIVLITLFCVLSPALGDEYKDENPFTEEMQIKEIIKNSKPTNSDILNEMKGKKDVVAIYGKIPEKKEGVEYYNWWSSISNISDSILYDGAMNEFLYGDRGYVIGYGPQSDGYILISIHDIYRDKLDANDVAEIASIFEKYAKEEGVFDVPLVFMYRPMHVVYDNVHKPLAGEISFSACRNLIYNIFGLKQVSSAIRHEQIIIPLMVL